MPRFARALVLALLVPACSDDGTASTGSASDSTTDDPSTSFVSATGGGRRSLCVAGGRARRGLMGNALAGDLERVDQHGREHGARAGGNQAQ